MSKSSIWIMLVIGFDSFYLGVSVLACPSVWWPVSEEALKMDPPLSIVWSHEVPYIQTFSLVLNALDNVAACRRVNRLWYNTQFALVCLFHRGVLMARQIRSSPSTVWLTDTTTAVHNALSNLSNNTFSSTYNRRPLQQPFHVVPTI